MMSDGLADMMCCASCGKAEAERDDVKLKICTACKLVKYCSVDCQKNHRPHHKRACKKRVAEIRDAKLFTQPNESYLGECPICCLPLSLDLLKSTRMACCCKLICKGCNFANKMREREARLEQRCPYCREPVPTIESREVDGVEAFEEKMKEKFMERAKTNDPAALCEIGRRCFNEGDYEGAFGYLTNAAGLGDIHAHYILSLLYADGKYVEKDLKKEVYHLKEAAIGGHDTARYRLGNHEYRNGQNNRAIKHWIIAANLGDDESLETLKKGFMIGLVSKEDFEAALRGHQAAVDATKTKQREEAYAFYNLSPSEQRHWLQSFLVN